MTDPQKIYLEPTCPHCIAGHDEEHGRMWAEDDVWGGGCPGCGGPVEAPCYQRADIAPVRAGWSRRIFDGITGAVITVIAIGIVALAVIKMGSLAMGIGWS
jgi:hypothetical protein